MKRANAYWVKYRLYGCGEEKGIDVLATSKADAYDKAVFEAIPEREGEIPYSAWVDNVTYNNGKQRFFNTSEGNAY